jgi:hypothetical protein
MNRRGAFVREQLGSFFLPVSGEQHQRVECLIVRTGPDVSLGGNVCQKLLHIRRPHVAGMPLVVKEDEPKDQTEVAVLGAPGIGPHAKHLPGLVEQPGRPGQRHLTQVPMQHLAVEEIEGVPGCGEGSQRLFLGTGDRFEELDQLGQCQLAGMALAVEQDEAAAQLDKRCDRLFGVPLLSRKYWKKWRQEPPTVICCLPRDSMLTEFYDMPTGLGSITAVECKRFTGPGR